MKVRYGFVSNSSSSSFLIVGVQNKELIRRLLKKDKPVDEGGYGISDGKVVNYYGGYSDEEDSNYEYAGMEIEGLLENNNLQQIRKTFLKKVNDELGIELPEKSVKLFYGEVSSE